MSKEVSRGEPGRWKTGEDKLEGEKMVKGGWSSNFYKTGQKASIAAPTYEGHNTEGKALGEAMAFRKH